jgi:hypothetical protein
MNCVVARVSLPSPDCYIHIAWLDLDSKTNTTNPFGCDQSASGAQESIEDNVAARGKVE